MKQMLLLLLCLPLALFGQQGPIAVGPGYPYSGSYSSNTFARNFEELHNLEVQLLQPAYYHARKIKKIELRYTDNSLLWMVSFDNSGKVLETGRNGYAYFIVDRQRTDTLQHSDTLVRSYYKASRLMRRDTVISTEYKYQHADTLMAFTRTYSSVNYNGALINEQNEHYNTAYLHKAIPVDQNNLEVIDYTHGRGTKTNSTHVYLHHKLGTDYDSTVLYHCKKETRDISFYAVDGPDKKMIPTEQLKHHPFFRLLGSKDHKDCYTDGACFNEPAFYYESHTCGTGAMQAEEHRRRTHYGFTSAANGLYDTFYSEYDNESLYLLHDADAHKKSSPPERTTILKFKYEYFE